MQIFYAHLISVIVKICPLTQFVFGLPFVRLAGSIATRIESRLPSQAGKYLLG